MSQRKPSKTTHLAAIALGSNLGDRDANLQRAVARLAAVGEVQAVSRFYDTAPVGYLDQPRFLNGALLLQTTLAPLPLLRALLAIEQALGRDRTGALPKGPRLLDLDLLLYDQVMLNTPELTLPHRAMAERRFVLQPLSEVAPLLCHPGTGLTIIELLARCSTE